MLGRYERTSQYSWYDEYKYRHLTGCGVRKLVAELSPKYYKREEVPKEEFSDFTKTLEYERAEEFFIDELMGLIHDGKEYEIFFGHTNPWLQMLP